MPGDAWNLSTIDILASLNKKPSVNGVLIEDLRYSVLDDGHVSYHNAQILAELHQINLSLPPREFVAFRPERLAWHETIVAVSTRIRIENESDMQHKCMLVYDDVIAHLDSLQLELMRKTIEMNVANLVNDYLNGVDISNRPNGTEVLEICKQVEQHSPDLFGTFKDGFTSKDAIIIRATDILYTKVANRRIQKLLEDIMPKYEQPKEDMRCALTIPAAADRCTFIIAGGQASGKGSSVERIKMAVHKQGIQWDDVVKINTDSYKILLLQPGTTRPELFSQLAQEEAGIVHQKIQRRLVQMAEQGRAPHVFVDQVFVGQDKIEMGLMSGGKVQCIVVSTDVGDAIERSYQRGLMDGKAGRYENTRGILQCHKKMTQGVPVTLANFVGRDVQLLLVDNNVPKGEQPDDVMGIDLKKRSIEILSPTKLERFIHKCQINVDADSRESLYTGPLSSCNFEIYLAPLLIGGCSCEVIQTMSRDLAEPNEKPQGETEHKGGLSK